MGGLMGRVVISAGAMAAAWSLGTSSAMACIPLHPCAYSNRWTEFELAHTTVPADGVLVFRVARVSQTLETPAALAYVEVVVTDASGATVAGVTEALDGSWKGVVWRPAAPWSPGENYSVSVAVDNDTLGLLHDDELSNEKGLCGGNLATNTNFEVATIPAEAFALDQPSGEQTVTLTPPARA